MKLYNVYAGYYGNNGYVIKDSFINTVLLTRKAARKLTHSLIRDNLFLFLLVTKTDFETKIQLKLHNLFGILKNTIFTIIKYR